MTDKQTASPSPSSSSSLFPFSTSLSSKQIRIIHAHKICTQFQKDRKKVVLLLSTGPPPPHSEKEGDKKKGEGSLDIHPKKISNTQKKKKNPKSAQCA
jgi:hypothetical protein